MNKFKQSWDRDREHWGFGILLFLFHFTVWLLLYHTKYGIAFCLLLFALYFYFSRGLEDQDKVWVALNDVGFEIFEGDEQKANFEWAKLKRLEVITGSGGPWGEDLWMNFEFEDDSICLPAGIAGLETIIPEFSKLPGYRSDQFMSAMGSTRNQTFLCFERA